MLPVDNRYVSFDIGGATYALPTCVIREITRPLDVTELVGSPKHMRGLINLRGRIVALVDPALLLGDTLQDVTDGSRILVVKSTAEIPPEQGGIETCSETVAILVSAIHETVEVTKDQVKAAPVVHDGRHGSPVIGVAQSGAQLITILSASSLVTRISEEAA